jgi:glycosyltransferase involved in cell wall biosynthesis
MRVLLVSGSFPPLACGVGDYTASLARALAKVPGLQVGVLTSSGVEPVDGASLQVFPIMPSWRLTDASRFNGFLREWSPDVVHIQHPTQGYGAGRLPSLIPLLAAARGARVVRTWHEAPNLRGFANVLLMTAPSGANIVVRPNFARLTHPANMALLKHQGFRYIMGASAIPISTLSDPGRKKLRARFLRGKQRLIVFFGFLYPHKGVELLFDIADAQRDHIVIAGQSDVVPEYRQSLEARAASDPWVGGATLTGYMDDVAVADLLAAADAVVLPFHEGGGTWNSSIHAAIVQGTPVVTTSTEWQGFDEDNALYAARPRDVEDMRRGLDLVVGKRRPTDRASLRDPWDRIVEEHLAVYAPGRSAASSDRGAA